MQAAKPITAIAAARLTKPGRYAAGGGLYLQISKAGTKAWLLRYMRGGRARHMGLGPFGLVTLAEARQRALEARRHLLDGLDPIEERRARRMDLALKVAAGVTFKQCADRYVAA